MSWSSVEDVKQDSEIHNKTNSWQIYGDIEFPISLTGSSHGIEGIVKGVSQSQEAMADSKRDNVTATDNSMKVTNDLVSLNWPCSRSAINIVWSLMLNLVHREC